MAKISSYPILSVPTLGDLLIGTDVENLKETKNFTISSILGLFASEIYVPYTGAAQNVNIGTHSYIGESYIVNGGASTQFLKADGSLDGVQYTPTSRTLSINGTSYNLTANRSWDLPTIDTFTTVGTSGAATYVGKTLNIPQYQGQGNYITDLIGEATASGPGIATVTLSNNAVIGKVLTGFNITTGGTVLATDTIVEAFGKVQNQLNTVLGGIVYQGTWNAATNTPTLTSSVGTKGHYYIVNVAGTTNLNGITDWGVGDWVIFDGSVWSKVDNTDSVVSVNGYTGAVSLTTTDIPEGTNLYYTDVRARDAISLTTTGSSGAATYSNLTGVLNVPEYTLSGLGGVPSTRTLSINGTSYDLSANRSWTVGDVRTDSTYSNPAWIASLGWNKITSTPTTLSGYGITDAVPYTGATTNVALGEWGISAGYVGFDLTPTGTPLTVGTVSWDVDSSTLDVVLSSTYSMKVGEDVLYYVKNQTGSPIPKGTVVRADGTVGASGQIKIAPFIANNTYPSKYCMGVTTEPIANGANGFVIAFGKIRKINTSAYPNGTILYASPTVAGGFTATPPTAPNNIISVALVVYSDTNNGEIFVRPLFGSNITEDEGVAISSPTNGQVLTYNSTSGLWVNAQAGRLEQYASLATFPVTGSTIVTYLALNTKLIYYWSGSAYVQIAPDPIVTITPGLNTSVTGTYPNFTIGLSDSNTITTNLFNYYNFI